QEEGEDQQRCHEEHASPSVRHVLGPSFVDDRLPGSRTAFEPPPIRATIPAILSRKARRPRSTCGLARAPGELLLLRPVGEHGEELEAPQPIRLEDEVTS